MNNKLRFERNGILGRIRLNEPLLNKDEEYLLDVIEDGDHVFHADSGLSRVLMGIGEQKSVKLSGCSSVSGVHATVKTFEVENKVNMLRASFKTLNEMVFTEMNPDVILVNGNDHLDKALMLARKCVVVLADNMVHPVQTDPEPPKPPKKKKTKKVEPEEIEVQEDETTENSPSVRDDQQEPESTDGDQGTEESGTEG